MTAWREVLFAALVTWCPALVLLASTAVVPAALAAGEPVGFTLSVTAVTMVCAAVSRYQCFGNLELEQTSWIKLIHGDRVVYQARQNQRQLCSLQAPSEGVCDEVDAKNEEAFQLCWRRAELQDGLRAAGLYSAESEWMKYSCGDRAYYARKTDDTLTISLQAPPEGVCDEMEKDEEKFQLWWRGAELQDGLRAAGLYSAESEWVKHSCGDRAYYVRKTNDGTGTHSLQAPSEGVSDEMEEDEEEFQLWWRLSML